MSFFRSLFKRRPDPAAVQLGQCRATIDGIRMAYGLDQPARAEYAYTLRDLDDFDAGACRDTVHEEAFLETLTEFAPVELRPDGSAAPASLCRAIGKAGG